MAEFSAISRFMTIPFLCAIKRETTISGMVIIAMFFGCRVSGEKTGILNNKAETCFNLITT